MSRCSGRVGATPKPQLPMTTVVTPCQHDGREVAVPEHLGVVVRVDVDEARGEHEPVEVDDLGARPPAPSSPGAADRGDAVAGDGHVGRAGRRAGAVDQGGVAQQQVHGRSHVVRRSARIVARNVASVRLLCYGRPPWMTGLHAPAGASSSAAGGSAPAGDRPRRGRSPPPPRRSWATSRWRSTPTSTAPSPPPAPRSTTAPGPGMAPAERADVLRRAADLLRKRTDDIAGVTADEMGCAISQAPKAQTGMVAPVFDYYADLIAHVRASSAGCVTADRAGAGDAASPVGVVAAIVPWNAPVTLAAWKVAPALAAGVHGGAQAAARGARSATSCSPRRSTRPACPPGVVNVVPGGREVGEHLVTHPGVDKVAFTGSTAAGKRIMACCGERVTRVLARARRQVGRDRARRRRPRRSLVPRVVGGGHAPVGPGVRRPHPHPRAAGPATTRRSTPPAAPPSRRPRTATRTTRPPSSARSSPSASGTGSRATSAGPSRRAPGSSPAAAARPTCRRAGTSRRRSSPTSHNDMRVAREEIFGPVLSPHPLRRRGRRGRASPTTRDYGLSGGVWTGDDARAWPSPAGCAPAASAVNGSYPPFPLVPFGGFKESGLGRELGPEGLARLPRAPQHRPAPVAHLTARVDHPPPTSDANRCPATAGIETRRRVEGAAGAGGEGDRDGDRRRLSTEWKGISAPGCSRMSSRRRQLLDGDPQVHAGQVRAGAAVGPGAERDVAVARCGRGRRRRVGRTRPRRGWPSPVDEDLVALLDRSAADLGVGMAVRPMTMKGPSRRSSSSTAR